LGAGGSNWIPPPALLVAILAVVVAPAALLAVPALAPLRGYARALVGLALGFVLVGNILTSLSLTDIFSRL